MTDFFRGDQVTNVLGVFSIMQVVFGLLFLSILVGMVFKK